MDEELAADIARFGAVTQDPVWRLPLRDPYDKLLEGKIADLTNISGGPFAGSITGSVPAPLRPTDEGELGVRGGAIVGHGAAA